MIEFFQVFISFCAVLALSVFAARQLKVNSGLVPLPMLCAVMILCVLGGYVGILYQTALAIHIVALAAVVYMVITRKKGGFKHILNPSFLLFAAGGFCLLVFLAVRTPVMMAWDEYSMWGTAVKMTKAEHMIFSAVETGFPFAVTQKPGLPILSYFFNFFGEYFAWKMYFAYDLLLLSIFSTSISALKSKKWQIIVPTVLSMFLLNFLHVYTRFTHFDNTYLSSYADFPMAYLAGGAVVFYFSASALYRKNTTTHKFCVAVSLPLSLIVTGVALCKDTGLALAFIAAAIICADLFIIQPKTAQDGEKIVLGTPFKARVLLSKLITAVSMFGSVIVMFVVSSMYLSSLGFSQGNVGGVSNLGYAGMIIEGMKQLLGLPPSEAGAPFVESFASIKSDMIKMFFPTFLGGLPSGTINMWGSGFAVMLMVLAICAGVAILCKDSFTRVTAIIYGVVSTVGFLAYYVFIGFTYVYVFKTGITDYNRYINTYYIFWLCGAFALIAIGASKGSYIKNSLTLGTIALSSLWLLRFTQLVQPQLCIIDYSDILYAEVYSMKTRAQAVQEQVEPGDKIFFVDSVDIGLDWFRYHYEFYPENILTYSNGGGSFADANRLSEQKYEEFINYGGYAMPMEEVAAYLVMYECEYMFIDLGSLEFFDGYKELFSDGGLAAQNGETILYKVNVTGTPQYREMQPEDTTYAWEVDENGEVVLNNDYDTRYMMVNATECVSLTPVEMEVPSA